MVHTLSNAVHDVTIRVEGSKVPKQRKALITPENVQLPDRQVSDITYTQNEPARCPRRCFEKAVTQNQVDKGNNEQDTLQLPARYPQLHKLPFVNP